MPVKKIYRSRSNKIIAGVCGGIAEYFDIDPTLVRIFWLIFAFIGGSGFLAYLVAVFIIPKNPETTSTTSPVPSPNVGLFLGVVLIMIGFIFLFDKLGFYHFFRHWDIPWQILWAIVLIFIGLSIVYRRIQNPPTTEISSESQPRRSFTQKRFLYRSLNDRKIAGVCGGLAEYFNVDSSLIRIVWVLGTFASIGMGLLAYVLMVIIIPENVQKDLTTENPPPSE